jgi:hypothetical protein
VVEYLFVLKCETLSSHPSTSKKSEGRKEGGKEGRKKKKKKKNVKGNVGIEKPHETKIESP